MVPRIPQQDPGRRRFLAKLLKWMTSVTLAVLAFPLLRFTGFTVKPQPRYIKVNKNLAVGGSHTDHDFILFLLEDGPVAVSRRCTHLGCRVNYRQESDIIECPCHQSRFTPEGKVVAGPAQKDLPNYPVRVLQDENGMTSGYEVTV
ncbi:MAG: ubiquinol-cytochrome c reductase iron-sulfur subunit [Desulfobulbaceae bacterium]|jgi:cytochrome b6-f complex iron-sulfur subunit|nr:ubiquinol-cytochrome c reductase iron-sulfur subunit [Desulfobulbaceae bacterium]